MEVKTDLDINEILLQLERVHHDANAVVSRSSEVKRLVVDPYYGDFSILVQSMLQAATGSQLKKLFTYAEDCEEAVATFCKSERLEVILNHLKAMNHTPVLLKVIEFFAAAVNDIFSIPPENLQQMTEFAAECLPKDELALAERSTELLFKIVQKLSDEQLLPLLQTIYKAGASHKGSTDSVVFMRYLTFFSKICNSNDSGGNGEIFSLCNSLGAVRDIIDLCQSSDVLLQMTALELLVDLADSTAGLEHLSSADVISWLITASCGAGPAMDATTTLDPLIASQAMRILGQIFNKAAIRGYDLTRHISPDNVMHFMRSVYYAIEEGEESEKLAGLVVTSDLARISVTTLQLVVESDVRTLPSKSTQLSEQTLLSAWVGLFRQSKAEITAAVLKSIAAVLDKTEEAYVGIGEVDVLGTTVFLSASESKVSPEVSAVKEKVISMKKRIFISIGQAKGTSTTAFLLKSATQPIESVRYAAVDLLRALASQRSVWGLQQLFPAYAHSSGTGVGNDFLNYLTERNTEYSKLGKDWKFSLITAIANSPARGLLSDDVMERIDAMVKQGPYYKPAMPDVLTADS